MLRFYKTLFVIIFKFLETFEGGWAHQTNNHRAFESVMGICVLAFINTILLFPEAPKGTYTWVVIIAFTISSGYFLYKKRYLKFLKEYQSYGHKNLFTALAIAYAFLTVLSMIYLGYIK